MKHFLLSLVILLAVLSVGKVYSQSITVDGSTRSYIVYAPKNLGENRPLLISCHGMNQDANYQKGMLVIESVADTAKFLTVFPQGIDKSWDISGDRDIHFVEAIIEKMVSQYKIDRNRVYLSGFSMGGMFTYHAMNKIPDKIAAFAPISGYPMWGTSANASVRPIPIIHTHGTDDDVVSFSGVQGALDVWIKHNGCPTTPKIEKNYRGAAHITRRTWGPGNQGVEVVLMELAGKGHWISNDNGVKTGDEIWRFCKRYSLDMKEPSVMITSPKSNLTFVTLGGKSQTGTITIEATASDPDGKVAKVQLYDGDNLLDEQKRNFESVVFTVEALPRGNHLLRVVVIDDEGLRGEASLTVSVEEPTGNYVFSKVFDTEGSVPQGWATFDGSEHRTGYSDGYTQGCRLFHFTGEQKGFEWGLYARNIDGRHNEGYARFADPTTTTTLMLYPGKYQLLHRLANWNIPSFSPVRVAIEKIDGTPAYEDIVTPTSNVGNDATNSFSGVTLVNQTLEIYEQGQYQITFYTADQPWADLVVGQAAIGYKGVVTGIKTIDDSASSGKCYDLQGRLLDSSTSHLKKGIIIREGKKFVVR
jgi:poly(3-hydroxybutyrate) depolymerase